MSPAAVPPSDARYTFDVEKLEELKKASPWQDDPKYFRSVAVSPSAVMKMMTHCHSGVEKGIKKGGNPIEVMGLMLGRPDPAAPRTLVVTDVFPLPIEGFETRVIADDGDVINHMIALGESLERTRKEKFMGWYHSHPFDLASHSHCYMSQTDISTQLQWQRAEDPHGNPFLAIVIDPLRSLAKKNPEMKAFRAYPPEYNSPVTNECPDGSIAHEEQARLEHWGSCWSRYYQLDVEYFMSGDARAVMSALTKNFLWMRTLGSTPALEVEARDRFPERVAKAAAAVKAVEIPGSGGVGSRGGGGSEMGGIGMMSGPSGRTSRGGRGASASPGSSAAGGGTSGKPDSGGGSGRSEEENKGEGSELEKACRGVAELATEKLLGNVAQVSKREVFS